MSEDNISKTFKKAIKVMTFSIIGAVILLIILVVFKHKSSNTKLLSKNNLNNIIKLEESFPLNCHPISTRFKSKYIALFSKKCNIIKIIDLSHEKVYKLEF